MKMIEILVALIALGGLALWGMNTGYNIISEVISPFMAIVSFAGLAVYCLVAWSYFAAGYQVDIVNREYGTSYTQEEMFYASDVIETMRELQRERIEVNGNLLKESK